MLATDSGNYVPLGLSTSSLKGKMKYLFSSNLLCILGRMMRVCKMIVLLFGFADRIHQTVQIETNTVEIEEKGIRLRLTVVDTPGFADAVDNTDW